MGTRLHPNGADTRSVCVCCSKELESCSLQVLSSNGSPSRYLLSQLSDRACSVGYLLQSLKKIDHKEAVQYLTAAGSCSSSHYS